MSDQRAQALDDFRRCCKEQGLAFTFQRQLIYEAVVDSREHPTPELIYEQVRQRIPSISLGTIYKNVKTFLDSGVLARPSAASLMSCLATKVRPHPPLECTICKAIFDIEESAVEPVRLPKTGLPAGFSVEQRRVEFVGICKRCQSTHRKKTKARR